MPGIADDTILNMYFEKCEFNDECDICGNPNKKQSWAKMSRQEPEVLYYLCQSCALNKIKEWKMER
ncbi:MAG: hypothetical protein KAQ89_00165 [Planctomycetes bacterium]|nr:hypothetical protein [Planctomycetota bacterium]